MSIFLKYNLKKVNKSLSPRSGFKQELWQKLDSTFVPGTQPQIGWYRHFSVRFAVVLVIGVIVVGTGATGVYAYNSSTVTDGTILYPVKKSIEQVEEKLQTTPEKKVAFLLKQIDRREAEKKVLVTKNKPLVQINKAIGQVERKLEVTSTALEVTPKKNAALLKKVEARLTERKERLEKIQEHGTNRREDHKEDSVSSTPRQKILDVRGGEVETSSTMKNVRERLRERIRETTSNRGRQ